MTKVKIICDSASDIRMEEAERLGVTVVPLTYTFDGETYLKDGVDMTKDEFFDKILTEGEIPKTSQITFDVWKEVFLRELDSCESIVCITMSAAASGTCQAATLARTEVLEERPDADITVIDSNSLCYLYGYAVEQVAEMAANGADKDEIIKKFNDIMSKVEAFFLVEDLKYLKKGGRINTATLVAANLMDIKPILTVRDGLVVGGEKIRGGKNLYESFIKHLISRGHQVEGKDICVIHSLKQDKLDEFCNTVQSMMKPASISVVQLGATIGAHAGPGLCAVLYIKD